jgi:hypothetical protein
MLRLLLVLGAVSALLYVAFSIVRHSTRPSIRRSMRPHADQSVLVRPNSAYFWGLLFALVFYYGFPLWWWRYGLLRAVQVMLACVAATALLQAVLRTTGAIQVDGLGESVAASLLLSVPIRAIGGLWVARRDAEWRSAILERRRAG